MSVGDKDRKRTEVLVVIVEATELRIELAIGSLANNFKLDDRDMVETAALKGNRRDALIQRRRVVGAISNCESQAELTLSKQRR